jgi:hypothetical protein
MGRHYPGNPRSHLSGRFVHAIPQTRRPDISYHSLNSHGRCRDAAAAPAPHRVAVRAIRVMS